MDYVPSMIDSFRSADIDQIAYAIAFAPSVGAAAPAPAPPLVLPNPIARYDLNTYLAGDTTVPDSVPGGSDAFINEYFNNTLDTSDPANHFLQIYAPNNYPFQTGGLTLPFFTSISAIELWVRYPVVEEYGQYFLDCRTGATNGFWITSSSADSIGSDFNSGKIWFNTAGQVINSGSGLPSLANTIGTNGWFQIVIYPASEISDDISLFMRYTGEQGMPIEVADILLYNAPFNDDVVKGLYNAKCSRYGLPPVV